MKKMIASMLAAAFLMTVPAFAASPSPKAMASKAPKAMATKAPMKGAKATPAPKATKKP